MCKSSSNQVEYFSIIEFQEIILYGYLNSVIHLDIPLGELTYQVYKWNPNILTISGTKTIDFFGKIENVDYNAPGKIMKNGKTQFKPVILEDNVHDQEVIFNYGVKLNDQQIKKLLEYCNALDFEPYRNKVMSIYDDGVTGYRDTCYINFIGITDSCIPKMEWRMYYYYDKEHIWPSEKLYQYILKAYLQKKETKRWVSAYGAFSLPI